MSNYEDVLIFWFEEAGPTQWWKKDSHFDELIKNRFSDVHRAAMLGEFYFWRTSPRGRLAEIVVLDQFSRNLYRDRPEAFAWDTAALVLSQEAIAAKADKELSAQERSFLYMPYMHSESLLIHEIAEQLFRENGLPDNLEFELKHKNIIERFGRYPHRNDILGRQSTDEERAFLMQPGSSF